MSEGTFALPCVPGNHETRICHELHTGRWAKWCSQCGYVLDHSETMPDLSDVPVHNFAGSPMVLVDEVGDAEDE